MSYIISYGDDQQFQAIMFLLQTAQGMNAGDPRRAGIIRQLDRLEKMSRLIRGKRGGTTT